MRIDELRSLSEAELRELSMQKNKKGNATTDTKKAQKLLWENHGSGFNTGIRQCTYGTKKFASADSMNGYK